MGNKNIYNNYQSNIYNSDKINKYIDNKFKTNNEYLNKNNITDNNKYYLNNIDYIDNNIELSLSIINFNKSYIYVKFEVYLFNSKIEKPIIITKFIENITDYKLLDNTIVYDVKFKIKLNFVFEKLQVLKLKITSFKKEEDLCFFMKCENKEYNTIIQDIILGNLVSNIREPCNLPCINLGSKCIIKIVTNEIQSEKMYYDFDIKLINKLPLGLVKFKLYLNIMCDLLNNNIEDKDLKVKKAEKVKSIFNIIDNNNNNIKYSNYIDNYNFYYNNYSEKINEDKNSKIFCINNVKKSKSYTLKKIYVSKSFDTNRLEAKLDTITLKCKYFEKLDFNKSMKIILQGIKSNLGCIGETFLSLNNSLNFNTYKDESSKFIFIVLNEGKSYEVKFEINIKRYLKYTFIDYLNFGMKISVIIAIDFSASNYNSNKEKNHLDEESFDNNYHFINNSELNYYQNAIKSCGDILCLYDSDEIYPVFGFGAVFNNNLKLKNNEVCNDNDVSSIPNKSINYDIFKQSTSVIVNHCFNINMKRNPYIYGINNVLLEYRKCLNFLKHYGPTKLFPILSKSINEIKRNINYFKVNNNNIIREYNILMILTDGEIDDMEDSIEAIIYMSSLPISIVIIGIGNKNFDFLHCLDADDCPLIDKKGNIMKRDIVQFVPYNEYADNSEKLVEELLKEIPNQILDYHNIIKK